MGTSMCWAGRNTLFEETFGKARRLARYGRVRRQRRLNRIVNETGIYPLEFTPRFGYQTIALQAESFASATGQFFYDLARGNDPDVGVSRAAPVGWPS